MGARFQRLAVLVVTLAVSAAVAVGAGAVPAPLAREGEPSLTPEQIRARAKTTAWVVTWDQARVMASLRAHQLEIGTISPFWYLLTSDGGNITSRTNAGNREVLSIAATQKMRVIPTLSNDFDPARLSTMLRSTASRRAHINQIVRLINRPAFAGVDIDYERVPVADRARFTAFVRDLGVALRARRKVLAVSVEPVAAPDESDAARAVDLVAVGRAADEVRVLAYDYSFPCGGSGAVSPIDWVEQVVRFNKLRIPARKIVVGTSLYGYDWPASGCAKGRTWAEVQTIRSQHHGRVGWSVPLQSRRMSYTLRGVAHVVWFDDGVSAAAKAKLVERELVRGVALWRIGGEDPATWARTGVVLGQARSSARG